MGVVRSVTQSFAVMRLLAGSSPLSLSAIGRALGLSPSSAFNLLKTLEREGAVERDGATKAYRIAPAWAVIEALGEPPLRHGFFHFELSHCFDVDKIEFFVLFI